MFENFKEKAKHVAKSIWEHGGSSLLIMAGLGAVAAAFLTIPALAPVGGWVSAHILHLEIGTGVGFGALLTNMAKAAGASALFGAIHGVVVGGIKSMHDAFVRQKYPGSKEHEAAQSQARPAPAQAQEVDTPAPAAPANSPNPQAGMGEEDTGLDSGRRWTQYLAARNNGAPSRYADAPNPNPNPNAGSWQARAAREATLADNRGGPG